MQLRQAEAVGVFHNHQRRVRHVDAHLYDRSGHKDFRFAGGKGLHDVVFFLGLHAPVHQRDPQIGNIFF